MIKTYNEKTFCIELIQDAYKTNDVYFIIEKAQSDLGIQLSTIDVLNVLNYVPEDYEKESWRIEMNEFFKDE